MRITTVFKSMGIVFVALLAGHLYAHEGHEHSSGSKQAPHGGIIKKAKNHAFELVTDSSGVKIYPLTKDLKPLAIGELTVSGTSQLPKKAKEDVKFNKKGDHFHAKIDAKGSYRYSLEVNITTNDGKKETVKFQVEP